MKKTFTLVHPKIKPARLVEACKHEIRKYLKRERNKPLPEGKDYWGFNCRFGQDSTQHQAIQLNELDTFINQAEAQQQESFYVEIIAKAESRNIKN